MAKAGRNNLAPPAGCMRPMEIGLIHIGPTGFENIDVGGACRQGLDFDNRGRPRAGARVVIQIFIIGPKYILANGSAGLIRLAQGISVEPRS